MPALGKGLNSLIPQNKVTLHQNTDSGEISDEKKIQYIPTKDIKANPWQPRSVFDREKLEELAESIKKHGIVQPIIVSRTHDGYQLIAGERRLRAAQVLSLDQVPAIVREATDRDKLELSIIENIQRHDLNALEEAASYKRLMEEFGMTIEQIAEHVGKGKSTVANSLRLLKLPVVIKEALESGKITTSHAKIILSYPTKIDQVRIFKHILKNNISTEKLQEMAQASSEKRRDDKPADPILTSWEDKLARSLGSKVKIDKRGERGQIRISFFSHAELKNILDKLLED